MLLKRTDALVLDEQFGDAIRLLSRGAKETPDDVKLRIALSFAYEQRGELSRALDVIDRLIEFLRNHNYEGLAGALHAKGRIRSKMGTAYGDAQSDRKMAEKRKAIEALDEATFIYPQYKNALMLKAMIGMEIGDSRVQIEAREGLTNCLMEPFERSREYIKLAELYYPKDRKRSEECVDAALRLKSSQQSLEFKRRFSSNSAAAAVKTESVKVKAESKRSRSRSRSPRGNRRRDRSRSRSRGSKRYITPRKSRSAAAADEKYVMPVSFRLQRAAAAAVAAVPAVSTRLPTAAPVKVPPASVAVKQEPMTQTVAIPVVDILKPVIFADPMTKPAAAAPAPVSLPISSKPLKDMSVSEVSSWLSNLGTAYKPYAVNVRIAVARFALEAILSVAIGLGECLGRRHIIRVGERTQ